MALDWNYCSVCNTEHNSKDKNGVCSLVEHCKEVDTSTGEYIECYKGYTFITSSNNCVKSENYFINC